MECRLFHVLLWIVLCKFRFIAYKLLMDSNESQIVIRRKCAIEPSFLLRKYILTNHRQNYSLVPFSQSKIFIFVSLFNGNLAMPQSHNCQKYHLPQFKITFNSFHLNLFHSDLSLHLSFDQQYSSKDLRLNTLLSQYSFVPYEPWVV